MLKVFAYNGSYRGENSVGNYVFSKLINKISQLTSEKVQYTLRSPSNSLIKECRGCLMCFTKGNCPLVDDMNEIKQEMLTSDLIILISPVFVHGVSGNIKTFIDRIGYWTHLMRLCGKAGVNISISHNNGNEFVNKYLDKISIYLGLANIKSVSIQKVELTEIVIESYIEEIAKRIIKTFNNDAYIISDDQEVFFQTSKNKYLKQVDETVESLYWKENNYLCYEKYKELFFAKRSFTGLLDRA